MGELISLSARLADRTRSARSSDGAAFFYAPGCPISYLVAERAERILGEVDWIPVPPLGLTDERLLAHARREAVILRLPLQIPDNPLADPRPLTRAACLAGKQGVGPQFGLAAARLIYCGGYEIDDPRVVVDAAEVAGLSARAARRASMDVGLDPALEATTAGLRRRGLRSMPVIRVGQRWFEGVQALPGAAIAAAAGELVSAPSQPVG